MDHFVSLREPRLEAARWRTMGDDDADPRVAWLADKVCASLGCDVESFTSLMREDADAETKSAIEAYLAGARR